VRGKLEDAGYRCPLAPEPRPLPPQTRPADTQTEPQLEPATSAGVILPEIGIFCSYTRYSCGNSCNIVVKLVQEYHCFPIQFTSILQKQFATNMFLREANSYKRALALRNSWQQLSPDSLSVSRATESRRPRPATYTQGLK